ncbi:MAG: hypothetical protein R3202_00230 [Candidatus Competibacterales bacterium]|nr:hypothetical protein [Candidatus Competibacterales bacterium]
MFRVHTIQAVAAGLALAFAVSTAQSAEHEILTVQTENGTRYVTGGVGNDEQRAVKDLGTKFKLEVLLALKEGAYLADVPVRIVDEQGNTVLDVVARGPYLFADLAPGTYTVEATYEGASQSKTARVRDSGREQLNFYW